MVIIFILLYTINKKMYFLW